MSEANFKPRPWEPCERHGNSDASIDTAITEVVECYALEYRLAEYKKADIARIEANGYLMVASPDLYAKLQEAREMVKEITGILQGKKEGSE